MANILGIKTISFNANGGSHVPSQELMRNERVKQPSSPSRDGYDFFGWYADNGSFNWLWDFSVAPSGDMTLHARWEAGIILPIESVSITVTAPLKGQMPNTAASVPGGSGFTAGAVIWTDDGYPVIGQFLGSVAYTAAVTLTAHGNRTFEGGLTGTVQINGQNVTPTNITGSQITLSFTFPQTEDKTATGIAVFVQPTNMAYTHGGTLNLAGLVVRRSYSDLSVSDIPLSGFAPYITTNPLNGTVLSRTEHDGTAVTVHYGTFTAATSQLSIAKAQGAGVTAPVLNGTPTAVSASVSPVSLTPATGQSAQYAVSNNAAANAADLSWVSGTTFNMAFTAGTYYVYARSAENNDYLAGTTQRSDPIEFRSVTFDSDGGNITPPVQIVYNGQHAAPPSTAPVKTGLYLYRWTNSGAAWDFAVNTVTSNITLTADWRAAQTFSITFAQITDAAPNIPTGLSFSQSGAGGQTGITITLPELPGGQTYSSISWTHGGHNLGSGTTLTLSNTDNNVNVIGSNKIISLTVFINGVPYSKNVTFSVVP